MSDVDAVIVGAGVIGLALARALAQSGHSVVVVEAAHAIGTGMSSRSSEVIHAGLYYPQGSLKARLCVEGNRRLYAFCAERHIPHRRCGKLVVACDESEIARIEALAANGAANGVDNLALLTAAEARVLEPRLACAGALYSPSTGIVDSHAFMLALQGDAADCGAAFAFRAPFLSAEADAAGFTVETGGLEPARLTTAILANCAGLNASRVARAIRGLNAAHVPETRYAKGNYFALRGHAPFNRLIYPAPQTHGLGVHLTFDLASEARFGPDVEWIETIGYDVDPRRAEGFSAAIRRYWPELPDNALTPAYAGVRPKIAGPNDPPADFRIDGPETHGVPGLINLFGVESPGLTASLAIADEAMRRLTR